MDYKKKNSITVIDNRTGHQKEIFLPDVDKSFSTTWGDLSITVARKPALEQFEKKENKQPSSVESKKTFKSDWTCTHCGAVNFGSKSSEICFKCRKSKPEPPLDLPYPSSEVYNSLAPVCKRVTGYWKCTYGGLSTTVQIGLIPSPASSWMKSNEASKDSIDVIAITNRFGDSIKRLMDDTHTQSTGNFESKELLAQLIQEFLMISPLVFSYKQGGGTWDRSETLLYGFILSPTTHFRLDFRESEYNVPGERDPSL